MEEIIIAPNTGRAFAVARGHRLQVYGTTIADFVAFDQHNVRERFDQARTKTYNASIYATRGHTLMSKSNEPLMTITEDTYTEGTHDLQKGMCSAARVRRAVEEGRLREYYNRDIAPQDLPDHGCWENLSRALKPYGIPPEDIPSPFNLFQTIRLELPSGKMFNTSIRPKPGTYIEFQAERDVLVAISACPDLTVGGKEIRAVILAP
jgi:uncharacterized protein YcgI (DUF1989 family)